MVIKALLHNARDGRLHPLYLGPSPAPEGSSFSVPGSERFAILHWDEKGLGTYVEGFQAILSAYIEKRERDPRFISKAFRWNGETPPELVAWFDVNLAFVMERSAGILPEPPFPDWERNLAHMPYDHALRTYLEAAVADREPFESETARHVALVQQALMDSKVSARWAAAHAGMSLDDLAETCILYGHPRPFDF